MILNSNFSTKQQRIRKKSLLFLVDKKANKVEIKKAIKEIYKVDAANVNTFISHGKLRKVRYQLGRTPDSKKAMVTLKEGQKIITA